MALSLKIKFSYTNFQRNCVVNLEKDIFEGVINVMNRLIEIIKPKKIFMGKKIINNYFLSKNLLQRIKLIQK